MADLSLTPEIGQWRKVLPFWVSYLLFPLIWAAGGYCLPRCWLGICSHCLTWRLVYLTPMRIRQRMSRLWQVTDGPLCFGRLCSLSVFLAY